MSYSNILELRADSDDARRADIEARSVKKGYINPDLLTLTEEQENEIFVAHKQLGIDVCGDYEDVIKNAKNLANRFGITVTVKAFMVDEEGDGMEWGEEEEIISPEAEVEL